MLRIIVFNINLKTFHRLDLMSRQDVKLELNYLIESRSCQRCVQNDDDRKLSIDYRFVCSHHAQNFYMCLSKMFHILWKLRN